jgi:hypothetical protein
VSASFIGAFGAISGRLNAGEGPVSDVLLEYHHFEPLVGKKVTFRDIPHIETTLTKIIRGEKSHPAMKREPFILIFRSPKLEFYMNEGMRDCMFEDGPSYGLYVTPIFTPEPEWQDYQAAFN